MERLIELCQLAIDNNDFNMALMLFSQNALLAKITKMIGCDISEFDATHNTMLTIILSHFPETEGSIHRIETRLEFTAQEEIEINYDSN